MRLNKQMRRKKKIKMVREVFSGINIIYVGSKNTFIKQNDLISKINYFDN